MPMSRIYGYRHKQRLMRVYEKICVTPKLLGNRSRRYIPVDT
jgi:hypothetical protein